MEIQQLINALQEADRQFIAHYDRDRALDHSLNSLVFCEKLIADGRAGKYPTMRGVRQYWAGEFQVGVMAYLGECLNLHYGLQWAFSGTIAHPLLVCDIEENLMPVEIWPLVGRFLRLSREPVGPLTEEIVSLVAGQVRNGFMQVGRSFWDSDRVVVYRKDLIGRLEHFLPECTIQTTNHQTILIITPDKRGVQIVLDSNLHEYLDGKLEAEPGAHAQQILALLLKENIVPPASIKGLESLIPARPTPPEPSVLEPDVLTDAETVTDINQPLPPPQLSAPDETPAMVAEVMAELEDRDLIAPQASPEEPETAAKVADETARETEAPAAGAGKRARKKGGKHAKKG